MSIIIALLIFSLIILFHEFGHFLLAKRGGITVVEFSLGMGPRLFSFSRGGTLYSLKLLPFGGSCMMLGEDNQVAEEGAFGSKSVWTRISVIAAGPVFNFLLAYVMSVVLLFFAGADLPVILSVSEGFPAQEAGIEQGDQILSINGKSIHLYREVSDYITYHQKELSQGKKLKITWDHEGQRREAEVAAKDNGSGRYVIGISGSTSYRTKLSVPKTLVYGAFEVGYWIRTTLSGLKQLFSGQAGMEELSGPVGVVGAISDTYEESRQDGAFYVFLNMLNIAILLSANLGVLNLLPIPALDGGRLVFLLLELIRRRPVSPEKEGLVHLAGFALLMALMVLILFQDVHRILF